MSVLVNGSLQVTLEVSASSGSMMVDQIGSLTHVAAGSHAFACDLLMPAGYINLLPSPSEADGDDTPGTITDWIAVVQQDAAAATLVAISVTYTYANGTANIVDYFKFLGSDPVAIGDVGLPGPTEASDKRVVQIALEALYAEGATVRGRAYCVRSLP